MDAGRDTLGLFPLGLVLLPGETIPLHVFEARYKRLIGERRGGDRELGIVYVDEDKLAVTGCTAVVSEVIDETEDGRMNILVEGRRRFRIVDVAEPEDAEADYLRADVEFFEDDEAGDERVRDDAALAFVDLLSASGIPQPQIPEGVAPLSFRLAAAVDFGPQIKQTLIESASENERLMSLAAAFRSLVPQAEAQRRRAEAIRGNGKGM
jgi:ATP-dependent Lon protease